MSYRGSVIHEPKSRNKSNVLQQRADTQNVVESHEIILLGHKKRLLLAPDTGYGTKPKDEMWGERSQTQKAT